MKKILLVVCITVLFLSSCFTPTTAQTEIIHVTVDGKAVTFPDAKPFTDQNGRTLIPVAFVAQALGANVKWDGKAQEVNISKDDIKIKIKIGDNNLLVNNSIRAMDTKAIVKYNRTFVPIRYVAEGLGSKVDWNGKTRTVIITTSKEKFVDGVYKVNPDIPKELYQYDYREKVFQDEPQSNKAIIEFSGIKKVTELMNEAKGYMETFYNVDYKTYNKTQYVDKLKWYFMPKTDWEADDGVTRPVEQHLQYWADMIQKKQISIKTEFITDPSLVYSTGNVIIRGQMKYMVENCNDMDLLKKYTKFGNVQKGKWYTCIVEVELIKLIQESGWKHAIEVVWNEYTLTPIQEVK